MAKVYIVIYNIYRMRIVFKNTVCTLILVIVIYLTYQLMKPKPIKSLHMKNLNRQREIAARNANALENNNAYINASEMTNDYASRFQENQPVVDRLPLVEETTSILPANEIQQMNYKDCQYKDELEKELYTNDAPLFNENAPANITPPDINDSSHRRVNFY
jgi:hypothetical protein